MVGRGNRSSEVMEVIVNFVLSSLNLWAFACPCDGEWWLLCIVEYQ